MVRSHTSLCFNVSDIPQKGLDLEFVLDPSQVKIEEADFKVTGLTTFRVRAIKVGREIIVKGQISATLDLACGRCLEVFSCPSVSSFISAYHPWKEKGEDTESEEEDLDACYYMDDQINLLPILREQIILSVPLKPLCSPGCRGLCQRCGHNLNLGQCTCHTSGFDERLSILKKLPLEFQKGRQ